MSRRYGRNIAHRFDKCAVGDLVSIGLADGSYLLGVVLGVDDQGVTVEVEELRGFPVAELVTVARLVGWKAQRSRVVQGAHYGRTSMGRARCEDAPCCGCCS